MSAGRGPADWAELRERIRDFYAYAFLPPSVTDDEFGSDEEAEVEVDGPRKPPAEPRVVADADDASAESEAVERARQYARRSRKRVNEFYEYAFLPRSVTDDDLGSEPDTPALGATDFDGFVFTEWLDAGRTAGPQKPPTQPRVVTDETVTTGELIDQDRRFEFGEWLESEDVGVGTPTQQTPEPTTADREHGEFEFVEWLASDESGFEPISIGEEPAEPVGPATPEPEPTTGPRFGIKPHPAKAATYALFLAVLTLSVLSVVGYAPVLGPATGLGG
ncbi:MAG: hypothetical protein ACI8U4_000517 [Natronomonas sp.]|jgi:hypothetical protein